MDEYNFDINKAMKIAEAMDMMSTIDLEEHCSPQELAYCSQFTCYAHRHAVKSLFYLSKAFNILKDVLGEDAPLPPIQHNMFYEDKEGDLFTEQVHPPEGHPTWDTIPLQEQVNILKKMYFETGAKYVTTVTPVVLMHKDKREQFILSNKEDHDRLLDEALNNDQLKCGLVTNVNSKDGETLFFLPLNGETGRFAAEPELVTGNKKELFMYNQICKEYTFGQVGDC